MKTLLNCMSCGEEFEGEEPKMCCSGYMCGCMGMPIDPIVCSIDCYYHLPMFSNLTDEERKNKIDEAYLNNPHIQRK